MYRDQNVLVDLVKRSTALVIDRNLIANANRYGRPILGAHIERYLIDAMRRLIVAHPAWSPNQERSRVWHGPEGLFIVWPNAVTEMRKLLEEDELPGIPQSPQTILEILTGAGVLVPASDTNPLWSISPPPGKTAVEAVRLSSPEILLPAHGDHKPLQEPLTVPSIATETAPKPPEKAGEPHPPDQRELPLSEPVQAQSPKGQNVVVTPNGEVVDTPPAAAAKTVATAPPATTTAVTGLDQPVFRLSAPMRLQPQVRDALAAAIDTMNGDAKAALAVTVPTGIFIPEPPS